MLHTTHQQRHQGMTLIEVLIATVVVAIGLLGVASLEIAALQGSSNADYRSRAIDFATALSDRMHANLIAVADNDYLQVPTCNSGTTIPNCAMTPNMATPASTTMCTPAQMASYDLHQITCNTGIQNRLPNGELQITCLDSDTTDVDPCSDLSHLLIHISWQQQNRGSDTDLSDVQEIVMVTIPRAP
jgi:type IV pilus assembly protein PilV